MKGTRRSNRAIGWGAAACLAIVGGAAPARAGEPAQPEAARVVAGSHGPGDIVDIQATVGWSFDARQAAIRREAQGELTGLTTKRDLLYYETRQVLDFAAQVGVFHDLSLFLRAPLVVGEDRRLEFDRRADCARVPADCVNEASSTVLRDGILPRDASGFGWDATRDRAFTAGSSTVFRGPKRKGFEYLGVGAAYAVTNQDRDETKPTWILALEGRLQVGKARDYDAADPDGNTGVGLGYHQIVGSTTVARRFGAVGPYVGGWFAQPIVPSDSPYKRYALGEKAFAKPQQRAGGVVGVEGVAWERPELKYRLAIEARGRFEYRNQGLAQAELWEPLAGRSDCKTSAAACRPGVDVDFDGAPGADPASGITRSPGYGTFGLDLGASAQAGPWVRFRGLVGMTFEQARFLTDNLSRNAAYDITGRRFRVDGARAFHVFLEAAATY